MRRGFSLCPRAHRCALHYLEMKKPLHRSIDGSRLINLSKQSLLNLSQRHSTTLQYTVEEAKQLLIAAKGLDLVPYIAVGLFAGVRMEEMCRLRGRHFDFQSKVIFLNAEIAKKRAQRTIDMLPALLAYLEPYKDQLKDDYRIAEDNKITRTRKALLEASQLKEWKNNSLRHSYGSYHFAMFNDAVKTSHEMGNSADMVHTHYKALVLKSEAEKYWNLRPCRV